MLIKTRLIPFIPKILEWTKLVTVTGLSQTLIQVIGFLSGILLIRLLPIEEYALYTLANTMLGTMTLLADGGITAGVLSQGGKVWQDKLKLGTIISTGLHLRKKFAVVTLVVTTPLLLWLLQSHGASPVMAIMITASLIPAFFMALSAQLYEITPRLHQVIISLQKIQVEANIARLVLIFLFIFLFPWAYIALLASGLPQIRANIKLRKLSLNYADHSLQPNAQIQTEILALVKKMLPGVVYFCLSGQITIWIISFYGSTSAVAHIGALGRLAMILSIFNIIFTTLVSPRFARLIPNPKILALKFKQINGGVVVLSFAIVFIAWIFASELLWLLGPEYKNLQSELVLNIIGGCLGLLSGVSFSLFISRGWVINPLIMITISILPITLGAMYMDLSTLKGVLMLNIIIASTQVVLNYSFGLFKINRMPFEYS